MSEELLVSATQMAGILDMTERRVQQLASEKIIPKGERGKYPMLRCVRAYISWLKERSNSGGKISIQDERAKLTLAQRELEEIKLAEKRGELIPADEIESLWTSAVVSCKSALMGWGMKLPEQIIALGDDRDAVAKLIKTEIHAALNLLADTGGQP